MVHYYTITLQGSHHFSVLNDQMSADCTALMECICLIYFFIQKFALQFTNTSLSQSTIFVKSPYLLSMCPYYPRSYLIDRMYICTISIHGNNVMKLYDNNIMTLYIIHFISKSGRQFQYYNKVHVSKSIQYAYSVL